MSRPRFRRSSLKDRITSRLASARSGWTHYRPTFDNVESRILLATFAVPAQYPTITAAVNAANAAPDPSNIVLVAPGTYHESNITIASPLTLISTNGAASTIIDGGHVTEAQTGVIRDVEHDCPGPSPSASRARDSRSRIRPLAPVITMSHWSMSSISVAL